MQFIVMFFLFIIAASIAVGIIIALFHVLLVVVGFILTVAVIAFIANTIAHFIH